MNRRILLKARVLTCLLAAGGWLSASEPVGWRPAYPLKRGPGGRCLVDQQGRPVFINGDSPWSLVGQLGHEDVEMYLRQRSGLGVNSLIVTIPEGFYADGCQDEDGPNDRFGHPPFLTRDKLRTPNSAYFDRADWVIRRAGDYGMQVMMSPLYTGYDNGQEETDGWYRAVLRENSVEDCRWYGEWIGARYRHTSNLVYVIGNDRDPGAVREKLNAFAEGIRSKDPVHLMTYHARPGHSSAEVWDEPVAPWLTLNGTYTYGRVWEKALQDYRRLPRLPFVLFESRYENEGRDGERKGTPLQVRKQAYEAVLGGAVGHHYGNGPVWHMNAAPSFPNGRSPWKPHLEDIGARTLLPNIRRLFESRAWYELVPDTEGTLVQSRDESGEAVAAACCRDGSTLIAYLPAKGAVTVSLSRVSGGEAQVWWFNPREGTHLDVGRFSTASPRTFETPSEEDWVLVIDDAARRFPPPGLRPLAAVVRGEP